VRVMVPGSAAFACGRCEGARSGCEMCGGSGRNADVLASGFLAGARFDVDAVRAYCERLVAEGGRLAAEREVFADWTRARGEGPESYDGDWGRPGGSKLHVHGGWPGPLAREYGWERCEACGGKGVRWAPDCEFSPLALENLGCRDGWHVSDCLHSRTRCIACKGRGRTRKPGVPPGFANGDSIARTARRLLDTLDGRCPWAPGALAQASECGRCAGRRWVPNDFEGGEQGHLNHVNCPDCRGTGHNLSGVLPEVGHQAPRVSEGHARHSIAVASLSASARFEFPRAALLSELANAPSLGLAGAHQRLAASHRLMRFSAAEVAGG
jgi:hypothetical protein